MMTKKKLTFDEFEALDEDEREVYLEGLSADGKMELVMQKAVKASKDTTVIAINKHE